MKGQGVCGKTMGPLGHQYGLSITYIDLVAGVHRPEKIFHVIFGGQKCDFFLFFLNLHLIVWDGQYRVSGHFLGPKGPISGQIPYFPPLLNVLSNLEKTHFLTFFHDFRQFAHLRGGRNRPEVAGYMNIS